MLLMLACSSSSSTSGLPGSVQHTENALSHFIKLDTKVLGDDYPTAPDDQGGVGGDVEVLGGQPAQGRPHLLPHPACSCENAALCARISEATLRNYKCFQN